MVRYSTARSRRERRAAARSRRRGRSGPGGAARTITAMGRPRRRRGALIAGWLLPGAMAAGCASPTVHSAGVWYTCCSDSVVSTHWQPGQQLPVAWTRTATVPAGQHFEAVTLSVVLTGPFSKATALKGAIGQGHPGSLTAGGEDNDLPRPAGLRSFVHHHSCRRLAGSLRPGDHRELRRGYRHGREHRHCRVAAPRASASAPRPPSGNAAASPGRWMSYRITAV